MRRRLSFALAAFAVAAPLAAASTIHGCSSEEFESVCLWVADPENCYRKFRQDSVDNGETCKPYGEPTPVDLASGSLGTPNGQFLNRAALDICYIAGGGQVIIDPPVDLLNYPPPLLSPPITYKMTFVRDNGSECGSASYTSPHGFSFTINAPPDAGASDAGPIVVNPDAGDAGVPLPYGTFTQVIQPGSDAFDSTCPSGESHHFNLVEVSGASFTDDGGVERTCPLFERLVPQASLVISPGGINIPGGMSFTVYWPPIGTTYPDGALLKTGTPVDPVPVTYFNCSIGAAPETCQNGVQDPNETDKDCGGAELKPGCPARCGDGQLCVTDCDCDPALVCNVVQGVKLCGVFGGGGGTGGDAPAPLPPPPRDCSAVFICENKKQDGIETDIDCGGTDCKKCNENQKCKINGDCISDYCFQGLCLTPNCNDGILSPGEIDTDCGGPCPLCGDGATCTQNADCASGNCVNDKCGPPNCTDDVQNGSETDVDCGGSNGMPNTGCDPCDNLKHCKINTDCKNNACVGGICLFPSCTDQTKDGNETDKDCGGPCSPCADGATCNVDADCVSGICGPASLSGSVVINRCFPTSCNVPAPIPDAGASDSGTGGAAPVVDAGTVELCGGNCPLCINGAACTTNAQCLFNGCVNGVCATPACDDTVQDGTETDVDCGGTCTQKCAPGQKCLVDSDCAIQLDAGAGDAGIVHTCINNVCQAGG